MLQEVMDITARQLSADDWNALWLGPARNSLHDY
jgi:hypothetical protein